MKILTFKSAAEFRSWLEKEHAASDGIWLRIFKKGSGEKSITHSEALDQALCYGWIDGQTQSSNERSWLQKFTPRRPKSGWSKLNTSRVERLMKAAQMTRAGVEAVEAAKADGRWQAAYDSPRNAAPAGDFLKALEKSKKAKVFLRRSTGRMFYAIVYRLQTAKKPETRERRIKKNSGDVGPRREISSLAK